MSEKDNNVMPLATDLHNLGEFDNVYDAMRRYPNGGVDGDYIYILGVQHFWNVNRQSWGILKDKEDNLVQMVEDFIGLFERRGYVFAGYALPDTTPVSGLDNIFYIAAKNGVYTHFGSDLKLLNEVAILRKPRRSSIWIKDSMDIPNSERIDAIDDAISRINVDIKTIKSAIIGMENDLDGVHDSIDDINKDIDAFKKETSENFEEVNSDLDKVEKRLDYIPKESFLSARPAGFKPDIDLTPEITVDRAWRDHEGNVIRDTYITRRGLRNEIIDITNQQVTDLKPGSVDPDDLSEATKQLIGNKSITNLPDEEDITVSENQTLKLKDKEYAPKDYSGMGRVYLRKHYVNGVNTLTQHMMRKPNTIYIIQYDYCLAGQTIEVPENCVLRFEGGSLRNGIMSLNYCNIVGKGLKCNIKNIPNIGLPLSSFLSTITDRDLNTDVFNSLIKESIPILLDFHEIYFSGELNVDKGTVLIESIGSNNANLFFVEKENQRGIVWSQPGRMHNIDRVNIVSNSHSMDFSNSSVYRSKFSNMEITSNHGNCIYAGDNGISTGRVNFDITFEKVHVIAPEGNGFYGMNGNTTKFIAVSSATIGDSLFYNCQGMFIGCNNQYYQTTGITYYKLRKNSSNKKKRYNSIFINCNIEDYNGPLFDCEDFGYLHLEFYGCNFYPKADVDGFIKESPLKLDGLNHLVILNCIGLSGTYAEGVGIVYVPSLITGNRPNVINYIGNEDITICDKNKRFMTLNKIVKEFYDKPIMTKDRVYKKYTLLDNIRTDSIELNNLIYKNKNTITIANNNIETKTSLQFLEIIPQGIIDIKCVNDLESYKAQLSMWNIIFDTSIFVDQPLRIFMKNANVNCSLTFINCEGSSSVLYGFRSLNGKNFTLNPGCCMEVLMVPGSYLNSKYGYVFLIDDFKRLTSVESTLKRPILQSSDVSFQYYDTTLNKPIWWTGTNWVDATGATV